MNLNVFLLTKDAGLKKLNILRIYVQIFRDQLLNKNIYLILIISIVFAISFWIGFNVNLLPAEASINAPIYDELFKILFITGLIIFIGMTVAVIYSLFKFRKRNDQIGDGIALEGNLSLEIIWTIIPSIIVLLIGLYSYNIYDRMGGMKELNHNHEMMSSNTCLLYTSPSPRDNKASRMPSSA